MSRFHSIQALVVLSIFAAAILWLALPSPEAATLPNTGLMGTVKSSDGKAMEGVAVTARSNTATFSTSVFTDKDGQYYFPTLTDGRYRVWAQAVGFQTARSEQRIASGRKIPQDFTLKPMADFSKQLSGAEWSDALPEETAEDRRLKQVFQYNCTGCHVAGYVLSKRFDAAGWKLIVDTMIDRMTQPDTVQRRLLQGYRDEVAEYLGRIRGAQSALKFKPYPRATGEATQIVVTEYDIPRADRPNYVVALDGSDWSEGVVGREEGQVLHDAVVGKDGNVYFTDNYTPERSIGRLDPRTGRVTSFKMATVLPGKTEVAVSTHGIVVDPQGNIWFTNLTENTIDKFDPKTEKFQRFPREGSLTGRSMAWISIGLDSTRGFLWSSQRNGAFRLEMATGKYTEFVTPTQGGQPYGMTVDSEGNGWFAQLQGDRVSFADARTGQVTEIDVAPVNEKFSPKDVEIGQRSGSVLKVPPVYQKGPRRMAADPKGDAVWVAEYFAGNLVKIDIHTKKVAEYPVPHPTSHPYAVMVDKNHMVWLPEMNGDRILKFNPFTEKFTEYPLPTLGTNVRFIDVDNSTDVPTLWVPYTGANKIARVQFR